MTKPAQIKFWKKQLRSSMELKEVANQNLNIATRLEVEDKKALEKERLKLQAKIIQ